MNDRITVQMTSRDRHSEVALAIQSLRTQTYQNWDLILQDDASGTPMNMSHFLMNLINRIKLEGHRVKLIRNNRSDGVCAARNNIIENDDLENTFVLRCDDDVILESDYLERLMKVIEKGYDMASGIVPVVGSPELERESKFLGPMINEHQLDEEGNLIGNKDECGYSYLQTGIHPTHQFRTNCLYKQEVQEKVKYPKHLTTVGFREEGFFSFSAIIEGFTIGVDTGAKAYHLITPSGGVRREDYNQCVQLDDESFKKWIKEKFKDHGNFLKTYEEKLKVGGLLK